MPEMKSLWIIVLALLVTSCNEQETRPVYTAERWEDPEWENPEIFQINSKEPTAAFYNDPSVANAIR